MGLIERFFKWLDLRRDIKLSRELKVIELRSSLEQRATLEALSALKDHTELMKMWLSGLQNINTAIPFSSVYRDDDAYKEETERLKQKPLNEDHINPFPQPWEMQNNIEDLLKDLNG